MIPKWRGGDAAARHEETWYWVVQVFEDVGLFLLSETWFTSLAIFMLVVWGTRFVWRIVRGLL